jgi:hypothetical protein
MGNEVSVSDQVAELTQQSFYEQNAERVITYRGFTAPLENLVKLCPINLSEKSQAQIDEYAAKIMVEAGAIDQDELEDLKKKLNLSPLL